MLFFGMRDGPRNPQVQLDGARRSLATVADDRARPAENLGVFAIADALSGTGICHADNLQNRAVDFSKSEEHRADTKLHERSLNTHNLDSAHANLLI